VRKIYWSNHFKSQNLMIHQTV